LWNIIGLFDHNYHALGYLGKLTLEVPWSQLSSKPAIISIDRVYLLAGPKPRATESKDEIAKKEATTKQRALQLAESIGLDKPDPAEDQTKKEEKKDDGFFARLGMKVVDNLQVFLNNIHIRYEDDMSHPGKPFVVGITLDRLHAQSTDDMWKPTFLTVGSKLMHKVLFPLISPGISLTKHLSSAVGSIE